VVGVEIVVGVGVGVEIVVGDEIAVVIVTWQTIYLKPTRRTMRDCNSRKRRDDNDVSDSR
jgi:hypothetical protein